MTGIQHILAMSLALSAAEGRPPTGYVAARRTAAELARQGKRAEALEAFRELAGRGGLTAFQQSDALEQAAAVARRLNRHDRAEALAGRIPLPAVAGTVRMWNLLARRKPRQVVEAFGDADLAAWPFWKAGEARHARGKARAAVGDGRGAERDLLAALDLTTDDLARAGVLLELGRNREQNLGDPDAALAVYRRIVEMPRHHGNARWYRGVLGAARILRDAGKPAEALATLEGVDLNRLRGYWHGAVYLALGRSLAAAGRAAESRAAYRKVLAGKGVHRGHRDAAAEALGEGKRD